MENPNIIVAAANVGSALLFIALAIPLVRGKVRMNRLYGVRFRKSFESDELWYKINRYGGWRLIQWSVVLLVLGLAAPWLQGDLVLPLAFAPLLVLVPCWQSNRYAKSL